LIDPAAIADVVDVVLPEDFVEPRARALWSAMVGMCHRGVPTEYVLVCAELERLGILDHVGEANVVALINCCPTSLHVRHYASVLAGERVRDREERRGMLVDLVTGR
jgi:replicative DNA helicase